MKTPLSQRSKKQALEEQEKAKTKERERNVITSLQGCYVEMGMLGITHTFGAVSVLEIRYLDEQRANANVKSQSRKDLAFEMEAMTVGTHMGTHISCSYPNPS